MDQSPKNAGRADSSSGGTINTAYEQGRADRKKYGNLAPCPYAEGSPEQDAWYDGWLEELPFETLRRKHGAIHAAALCDSDGTSERMERRHYEAETHMEEKD